MAGNTNLYNAKMARNDEFYTRIEDIEKELSNYEPHFNQKTVLCNADDPEISEFWRYFHQNFQRLGLKRLVSTHYVEGKTSYAAVYDGENDSEISCYKKYTLKGDGDFRSDECIEFLKSADLVVTNPPFSLFRDYLSLITKYNKKFLIIGSKNAITYKEVFPLLQNREMWIGCNNVHKFTQPDGSIKTFGNVGWYTNLEMQTEDIPVELTERYYDDEGNPLPDSEEKYPHYDGYDAINVDRLKDIPCDYFGIMGVPITFLDKFRPPRERERERVRCRWLSDGSEQDKGELYSKVFESPYKEDGSECLCRGERKPLGEMFRIIGLERQIIPRKYLFHGTGAIAKGRARYGRVLIKRVSC